MHCSGVLLKIKVNIRPSSRKNKGEHTPLLRWVYATLEIWQVSIRFLYPCMPSPKISLARWKPCVASADEADVHALSR
jgi:hypothetical protein